MSSSSVEPSELDQGTSSSPKARSYPSSSQRPVMYRFPDTKVCYFYKDGDINFAGVKLAVSSRLHPTIASLQTELTTKMTDLPFGVRSIYTPRGRNCIQSVGSLQNEGRYICSTFAGRAHGLDINRVSRDRVWNVAARPPSGKRAFNDLLRDSPGTGSPRVAPRRQAWVAESDHVLYQTRTPKKIVVVVSGDPDRRQTLLLYRRTLQTFEQVLEDLSEMFEMPVRRMFTMEGRMVKSLSAIYSGPEMYMVTNGERPELWRKRDSETPYEPVQKRRKDRRDISTKTKEKRDKLSKTRGKFKVCVTTDELPSAGTTAQVGLTVYGQKGDSGLIPLSSTDGGVSFLPGSRDEFEISVGNIGDIYKIRISHDNSGDSPGWLCDEVRLKDVHTEEEFLFQCRRWLSRDEDDSEICREIPVTRDEQHLYPVVVYDVTVLTGDLWNAGTSANVYMTIYGERGDTGVRQLYTAAGEPEKFRMGQSDSFTMEAVSLGNLTRVIVGHDGVGPDNGWFLDQVVVKEKTKTTTQWCFPCRRWLDAAEDDGKIVRELKLADSLSEEKYKKELFDHQKWKFQTGSHVILYSKMSQRPLRLGSDGLVDAKDTEDGNGVFLVLHKRGIYRIFQSLAKPNLHLAFDNGRLLGQPKSSAFTEFIVQPQPDRSVSLESVRFPRQFVGIRKDGRPANGPGKPSEPSQHFFVYCKGAFRDRGVVILWTSSSQTLSVVEEESYLSATGNRMRSAMFRVHRSEDVEGVRMFESLLFPNQFIRILDSGHCDVKGVGDRFCEFQVGRVKERDYITLESVACRGLFVGMTPEGRVTPTVDTGGGRNIRFYPEIVEYGNSKPLVPSPLPVTPETYPLVEKPRNISRRESNKEQPMEVDEREPSVDSIYEDGDWKVWLMTAESAKSADIALVIYGDHGNSGLIILGSSGSKGLFQSGNTDEFKVNLRDIGTVYKLRIELLPQKAKVEPFMKVKLVKLQNMTSKEVLRFKFDRWLSREKDDCDISRELPAVRPKKPVLPVVKYRVETYTGSLPGADTDATVYVNLFGERGDIGKRVLFRSDNETKFLEGQVDTFEFEAVSLGALTKCYISHDGFGPGEGWYCQQVAVTDLATQTKYVFLCDMWLDSSIDDGKTERILQVKANIPQATGVKDKPAKSKPGDWLVTTVTGQLSDHQMVDTVVFYVYGEKGVAGPIELGNGEKGKLFLPGKTDEFKVSFGESLGPLYKVRIGLLEEKEMVESSWFLEKLKMKNLSGTREILSFDVSRWMSRKKLDCAVWRELAVSGPGMRPLPLIAYHVEVHTGSKPGSDTSASVFLHIFGSRGDAGKRRLYQSQNEVKFQLGQVDVFKIEAVSLDEISKVIVSHDCTRKGGGWYLEKIIIREGHARVFHLPCGRWLDAGKDDGAIERILIPQDHHSPSPVREEPVRLKSLQHSTHPLPPLKNHSPAPPDQENEWKIWMSWKHVQKKNEQSSADGVIAVIYGNIGISDEILLDNGLAVDDDDHVTAEYQSHLYVRPIDTKIGVPYKVRLGLKRPKVNDLFVNQVRLKNVETAEEYCFEVNSALSSVTRETGWVEIPLNAITNTTLPVLTYLAEVYTGDVVNAGTKANVHLTIIGERGDTGRRCLRNSLSGDDEMFTVGNVDIFEIQAVDLLKPQKLIVGHDGRGQGSGWFLEKVIIYCEDSHDKTKRKFIFPCQRWLDEEEDDGLIERELSLSSASSEDDAEEDDGDVWKVCTKTGVYKPEDEEEDEEDEDDDDGNTNNNANNEEELRKQKDLERRRKERIRKFHLPPHPPTGQLIVVVYGNRGKTGELPLNPVNPKAEDMFTPGHEDEFKVRISQDLGDIYKIRIGFTDDTEEEQNWLLDSLMLEDAKTGRIYRFHLNSRLIKDDEFDGCCEIPLVPGNSDDTEEEEALEESTPLPVLNYTVEVYTGSLPKASTDATVHVMLVGERGDTGKRLLLKPLSAVEKPFQPGQVDVFEIAAVDLLDVRKVVAGHNGRAKGQGWFLEKVIVRVTQDDQERSYNFPCDRWLDASLDDGLIERELLPADKEDEPEREPTPSEEEEGSWTVSITTGVIEARDAAAAEEEDSDEDRSSGGQLVIVVYGDQGNTEELPLDKIDPSTAESSSTGNRNQFKVDFNDEGLGAVYKVRIGAPDGSTAEKNWFPRTLALKSEKAGKLYHFELQGDQTMGKSLDGWWEIPISKVKEDSQLFVNRYEVEVYTATRNPPGPSDYHIALFGERGDTGRRTFLKPLSSAAPDFPTPELLALKQQIFHQDDRLKRHLPESSTQSTPPPFPPSTRKAEIFNADDYEEIDKHAKAAPLDLASKSYEALVSYLVKPVKDDIGRVRALYVWIASQNLQRALDFIGQDVPSSGTPLLTLILILTQQWYNGYAELLSNMCSHAEIPCKVIKGKVKGTGHWIGKRHNGTIDYCIVYVAGAWRFIDPHCGSRFSSHDFDEPDSDSGSREEVARSPIGDDSGIACTDFYFLTDPEAFVFTHLTCDPALQLLAHPVSEDEFWEMAFLKEAFFDLEMTSVSHPKCVLEADDRGTIVLKFGLLKRRRCQFSYRLSKSTVEPALNMIDGASLDQFVMMENLGENLTATIHLPVIGRYKFELFGKDIKMRSGFSSVCEYAIYCKNPNFGFVPNPVNARKEWGPGAQTKELGLKPVEPLGGLVVATDGEAKIIFRMMKSKDVPLHGILRTATGALQKCVCHYKTSQEAVFLLKLPHGGSFLFQIFTKETEDSDAPLVNVCNYSVKSEQSLCDLESYLPVDDESNLVGDQTSETSDVRLKPVSHEEPVIGPLTQESLDITVSTSNTNAKFRMLLERHAHRNADAENMSEYTQFRRSRDILQISVNFPKSGFYKLSILTGDELLYVYLIDVKKLDSAGFQFPLTSPNWNSRFAVLKPRSGLLDAATEYLFRLKIPGLQEVRIEAGKVKKDLARAGTSPDVWEATVKTPGKSGSLKVFSKDQLLLTYKVLDAEDLQSTKHLQEKARKEESDELKKMIASKSKESERRKSSPGEKKRLTEEDFRMNRKKYEKEEALLEWREEEEVEKSLSEMNPGRPIRKRERFSSSIFGMMRQLNVFHLEAVDLLDIRKVIVGHDRPNNGDGCYLEKAVVCAWTTSGLRTYSFPCNRWLDRGLDDGRTERELMEESLLPEEDCWWKVSIKTGVPAKDAKTKKNKKTGDVDDELEVGQKSRRKASLRMKEKPQPPSGQLHVVVYGDCGQTKVLPLTMVTPDDPKAFAPGHVDEFKVKLDEYLGDVYKVRIGVDDSNTDAQNWLIDSVVLQDVRSKRTYRFDIHDRLLKDEEFDGWLEAAVRPTLPWNCSTETAFIEEMSLPTLPVFIYHVQVYTGDLDDTGADADVSVMLVGERGDSGRHKLLKSLSSSHGAKFRRGQMDTFEIEAVDLGDIRKVVIGQDGAGSGHGWFVDNVVVKAYTTTGVKDYSFTCDRWLFESTIKDGAETSLLRDDLKPKKMEKLENIKEEEELEKNEEDDEDEENDEEEEEEKKEKNDEEEKEQKKEEKKKKEGNKQDKDKDEEKEENKQDKDEDEEKEEGKKQNKDKNIKVKDKDKGKHQKQNKKTKEEEEED